MKTTKRFRRLRIDGMYDATSEQTVRAALGAVLGVTTASTRVGGATIECDDEGCAAACAALNAAGFRAWEARPPGGSYRANIAPDNALGSAGGGDPLRSPSTVSEAATADSRPVAQGRARE